jgi:hypothetical protein
MTLPIPPEQEAHSVSRKRRFEATTLAEVVAVLQCLRGEEFTGAVRIDMGCGGFNNMSAEETIKLVAKEKEA